MTGQLREHLCARSCPFAPLMAGPGGWATVARNARADQIQRRTGGRDKCENITDWKSKHPAQILEASVVHDRSGGRASFLSCTNLSLGLGVPALLGPSCGCPFSFSGPFSVSSHCGNWEASSVLTEPRSSGRTPLCHASTAWVVAGPGFFLSPLRKPYSQVPLSTDCSTLCSSGAFWNHESRFIHLLVSHMV